MTNTDDTDTNCVTKPDLTHDSLQALLSLLLVYDILNKISSLVMIDIEAGRRLYIRTCLTLDCTHIRDNICVNVQQETGRLIEEGERLIQYIYLLFGYAYNWRSYLQSCTHYCCVVSELQ